jgi:hypothetical protein
MALKPCKECGREVSVGAPSCPGCGAAYPAGKKTSVAAMGCLVLIIFGVLAGIMQSGDSPKPEPAEPKVIGKTYQVIRVCEDAMRKHLKAPASADFAGPADRVLRSDGKGTWNMQAFVDAQNSFGAKLRMRFICWVSYKGANYSVDSLFTSER